MCHRTEEPRLDDTWLTLVLAHSIIPSVVFVTEFFLSIVGVYKEPPLVSTRSTGPRGDPTVFVSWK